MAWVKPEANAAWMPAVVRETPTFYGQALYASGEATSKPQGMVAERDWEASEALAEEALAPNQWAHLALTSDGEDLKLYVDGELVDTVPARSASPTPGVLRIGGNDEWEEYFEGVIDEVRIYGRALGGEEVEEDAETSAGPKPPLCSSGETNTSKSIPKSIDLDCTGSGTIEYEITTNPDHGEITSFNSSTGALIYSPEPEFIGVDSFKFAANNSASKSTTRSFQILVGSPSLREGIVAAYGFNENAGEVTHDVANEHDGSLFGPSFVKGKYGSALNFVAEQTDFVAIPGHSTLDLSEAFTVEAWVRPGILGEFTPVVTRALELYDLTYQLAAGGKLWGVPSALIYQEGFSPEEANDTKALAPEIWSHLAMTYDNEVLKLFVNGDLAATESSGAPRGSEGKGTLYIGMSANDAWGSFDGKIDEVRIYDRALNGSEVQEDMITPIAGIGGSEDPDDPEPPEACQSPQISVSGQVTEAEVPGVGLTVSAEQGSPPCAENGEQARIAKIKVIVDEEVLYQEERACAGPNAPCSSQFARAIQLPYAKVIGTHDYQVEIEDHLGNKSKPVEWTETTPEEGTIAEVFSEAEDLKGTSGCETPKERYGKYRFKGKAVYGTECADVFGAYPRRGTTRYYTGPGDDIVRAGGEINKIYTQQGDDRVYAGRGNDLVRTGPGEDQIYGGSGDDLLFGEGADDVIAGGPGADVLRGNDGNDLLRGGGTADALIGGADDDTVSFADAVSPGFFSKASFLTGFPTSEDGRGVFLDLNGEVRNDKLGFFIRAFNGYSARFGGGVDKLYIGDGGFSRIVGSPFADYFEGSGTADFIDGGGGQDIMKGRGGDDTLFGGAHSDLLDGGDDQVSGLLHGGEGDDVCLTGGESCERESTEEGLKAASGAITIGRLIQIILATILGHLSEVAIYEMSLPPAGIRKLAPSCWKRKEKAASTRQQPAAARS